MANRYHRINYTHRPNSGAGKAIPAIIILAAFVAAFIWGGVMTQHERDTLQASVKRFYKMLAVEQLDRDVETFIRAELGTIQSLLDAHDEQQFQEAA